MANEIEIVARFNDLPRAQGARAALRAAGIEVSLRDENTGSLDWGLMPALGGLRVEVRAADAARAREILGAEAAAADLPEALEELATEDAAAVRLRKRRVGLVSLLILLLPTLVAVLLSCFD